jgi:cytochrome c peroxidase
LEETGMKSARKVALMVFAVVFAAGGAFAMQQEPSAEKGKALFNDPNLGTSGKTCNTCHENGKGLEKSGARGGLESTINGCITVGLKGKALDLKSGEMRSLVLYIKGLGVRKPATKKAPVGC